MGHWNSRARRVLTFPEEAWQSWGSGHYWAGHCKLFAGFRKCMLWMVHRQLTTTKIQYIQLSFGGIKVFNIGKG